ncbi:peptide deformylase [Aminipila butyrica]|uniref:Peptide deformylase n=1 Tax=Aminipila butyrica TaxID=433296 RepID=A0A858BUN5_9FIRM|nr:peptide deformylase [Aminipila butyrica]QIB68899.1 peptide deformylase [Aminipila butyrica]
MALREIRFFDDESLRKISKQVDQVDDHIREILNDMAETMYNTEIGGGLAACQVGILRRLVVIDMGQGLLKLVNPHIVESQGEHLVIEGCLSCPGVWGKVLRPQSVRVNALDENGEAFTIEAADELAKCLCHEIDHLDGILFIDKVMEYVEVDAISHT